MSWSATLTDDRGHEDGFGDYTRNTSPMIYAVLEDAGVQLKDDNWGHTLDGMTGEEGARFLATIITGLKADPDRFRAMNPANGWGDYDSLLEVLQKLHDVVPEWPTTWSVSQ